MNDSTTKRSSRGLRKARSRAGMALVLVLAIVVLLTTVILAFFVQTNATQQIETSHAHHSQADILARSASDYVVAQFQQEIMSSSNSSLSTDSGPVIYTPLTATNALPRRGLASSLLTDTNFLNLNRQSVSSVDPNASADSTATAAANGRFVSAAEWNKPLLLPGAGFTAANQQPNWIYVAGSVGLTSTPSASVLGRFAYNVYDLSGLLNVNAAGYPAIFPAQGISQLKETQAGADLAQIGYMAPGNSNLFDFRNPTTATSTNNYLTNAADSATNGFLSPVTTGTAGPAVTNNYFSSRQDLLHYAVTQQPTLTNALPYLTHFSRAVTAPSYGDLLTKRIAAAGTVTHYHDDGTTETYTVQAGDPLLQRRFSLAKLAWLTPTGIKAGISAAAVQACFGLVWDSSNDRWNYYGSTGSTLQASIESLSQVATEQREPNFFEMLKAGILPKSLGNSLPGDTDCPAIRYTLEGNGDLHLLRIGANIIDCADSDNYPTIVAMSYPGATNNTIEVAGVEDLPYFYSCDFGGLWKITLNTTDKTKNTINNLDAFLVPVFFNPHQASAISSSSSEPASVRATIVSGTLNQIQFGSGNILNKTGLTKGFTTLPPITIPMASFEGFRSGPDAMRGSAPNSLGTILNFAAGGSDAPAQGFLLYSYEGEYAPWPYTKYDSTSGTGDTSRECRLYLSNLIISLQYPAASGSGRMKTYATFAGNEAVPASGWQGTQQPSGATLYTTFGPSYNRANQLHITLSDSLSGPQTGNATEYGILWDPRTTRVGPANARFRSLALAPTTAAPDPSQSLNWNNYYWAQAGKATAGTGGTVNISDANGTIRPSDGWLASDGTTNPFTTIASRPIILQRPFRSVAELGYVYRDEPWKTLSFFDSSSADAGLLDLFSVVDEPAVTAGTVQLDTPQTAVLQALFNGVGQNSDGSSPLSGSALATALNSYSYSSGLPTTNAATNRASLPSFLSSSQIASAGLDNIKYHREAVVRAVADTTQTRTWNFLVDIVAQAGKFPATKLQAANFLVEGEKHYWVFVAIDRYTGKVVDQQWEPVDE